MSPKVKFCGFTRAEDIEFAVALGLWAIGLNLYSPSPRSVSLSAARELAAAIPKSVLRVGIFVRETRQNIERAVRELDLDAIQLCGEVALEDCLGWSGIKVITSVSAKSLSELARPELANLAKSSDYFLVDGYSDALAGGTGALVETSFAEHSLIGVNRNKLVLAGGLTPDNVVDRVRMFQPFAVDVASGIESSPGIKDHNLMRAFIQNAAQSIS